MWVLYLGLLASLMNILKIFLSFGPTLAPGVTPVGRPRGGSGLDFFKVSNPYMWVLFLGLLASLMNILKIFLSFRPTPAPGVTPGGQPQGWFER